MRQRSMMGLRGHAPLPDMLLAHTLFGATNTDHCDEAGIHDVGVKGSVP